MEAAGRGSRERGPGLSQGQTTGTERRGRAESGVRDHREGWGWRLTGLVGGGRKEEGEVAQAEDAGSGPVGNLGGGGRFGKDSELSGDLRT